MGQLQKQAVRGDGTAAAGPVPHTVRVGPETENNREETFKQRSPIR
ncbi:hypothetical protein [Melghirimyces profundicolus]|nr:hypothetical protein [Melghirimyces profundicolus]